MKKHYTERMNSLAFCIAGMLLLSFLMDAKAGAVVTGNYRNLFAESGHSQFEIENKVAESFVSMFISGNKIYHDVGSDMGYVLDNGNNDVRNIVLRFWPCNYLIGNILSTGAECTYLTR